MVGIPMRRDLGRRRTLGKAEEVELPRVLLGKMGHGGGRGNMQNPILIVDNRTDQNEQ